MARLDLSDLSDLGIRVTSTRTIRGEGGAVVAQEFDIDTSEIRAKLDRLNAAAVEFRDAWEALPPAVREAFDGTVITLRAHPE